MKNYPKNREYPKNAHEAVRQIREVLSNPSAKKNLAKARKFMKEIGWTSELVSSLAKL